MFKIRLKVGVWCICSAQLKDRLLYSKPCYLTTKGEMIKFATIMANRGENNLWNFCKKLKYTDTLYCLVGSSREKTNAKQVWFEYAFERALCSVYCIIRWRSVSSSQLHGTSSCWFNKLMASSSLSSSSLSPSSERSEWRRYCFRSMCVCVCTSVRSGPVSQNSLKRLKLRTSNLTSLHVPRYSPDMIS